MVVVVSSVSSPPWFLIQFVSNVFYWWLWWSLYSSGNIIRGLIWFAWYSTHWTVHIFLTHSTPLCNSSSCIKFYNSTWKVYTPFCVSPTIVLMAQMRDCFRHKLLSVIMKTLKRCFLYSTKEFLSFFYIILIFVASTASLFKMGTCLQSALILETSIPKLHVLKHCVELPWLTGSSSFTCNPEPLSEWSISCSYSIHSRLFCSILTN